MGEQGSAAEKGQAAVQGGVSVEECENMIQKSLKTPTVKFLREHMAKAGCSVGQDLIRAVTCDKHITGGYAPGEGIIVCNNHMRSQDDVNQVVKHKLINAYDDCRAANLKWADCAHHACSEIRANHLSGDCHYKRELLRGNMKIRGHEQECVRRRVLKAVAANPHCSEVAASDAMDAVSCMPSSPVADICGIRVNLAYVVGSKESMDKHLAGRQFGTIKFLGLIPLWI